MSKPLLGILIGAGLGVVDGLSAWLTPEAQPIIVQIVIGSTVKGVVTGLLAGLIATWKRSMVLGVLSGLVIGFALSSLAAIGQAGHYLEIVLPGMLVGGLVGFLTQKYPRRVLGSRTAGNVAIVLAVALSPGLLLAARQAAPVQDPLAPLAGVVGRWAGATEGRPGKGTVEREYERILGTRFIQVKNRSTYPLRNRTRRAKSTRTLACSA